MIEMTRNPDVLHRKIVACKVRDGDPRPPGMTLSLIDAQSADTYWSNWCILWNKPYRRRLSTNPRDYAWESNRDNLMRNAHDNEMYVILNMLQIVPGKSPQWMRRAYFGPIENIPSLYAWLENGQNDLKKELLKEYLHWYPMANDELEGI